MKNPFLSVSDVDKTEYLTSRVSLNRAVMAKLPLSGIADEIEGKRFKDIFSTPLIVEEIRATSRRYGLDLSDIPDRVLPEILDEALYSRDVRYKQMAQRVVRKFGERLGLIFLMLRTGEEENRLARSDWDESCWRFWHDIDTVILTGGLASDLLGRRFKEYISAVFDRAGVKPYHIRLFDNGSYLGVMGLGQKLIPDGEVALVLDLGHTGFKRAVVRMTGGEIGEFTPLESLPSLYTEDHCASEAERMSMALNLHAHIVRAVSSAYRQASEQTVLSDTIYISIANYVCGGVLDSVRGGFSKLSVLGGNYAHVLAEELSSELHRELSVRLVHDSTASALYFDDVPNAVCVTLGTAFGVGFPDTKIS